MGIWTTPFPARQLIDERHVNVGKYDEDVNLSALLAVLPPFPCGSEPAREGVFPAETPSA
jgi:hypothetical protein